MNGTDVRHLLSILPWRHPFLMIDRLVECRPHERIVTSKRVTAGDPLAACEDGGTPWFPGALLLEGMGQSAALLFRLSRPELGARALPVLGYLKAALHGSAMAGDSLVFEVRSVKMTSTGGVFEARVRHGSRVLAEADLAFGTARGSAT